MSSEKKTHGRLASERSQLEEAQAAGFGRTLATYTRLSGPGWLQSSLPGIRSICESGIQAPDWVSWHAKQPPLKGIDA